jgi:methionyl-tRNA synthetase
MTAIDYSRALEAIMAVVAHANRYIELQAPWKLAKQPEARGRLGTVLWLSAEVLRVVAVTLSPFMPSVSRAIWQQLGLPGQPQRLSDAQWPQQGGSRAIAKEHPVLFPRLEAVA